MITCVPYHLVTKRVEKLFEMTYEEGIRVNPSYNCHFFEVPTQDDEKTINEYEKYGYYPIKVSQFSEEKVKATRRIRRNEIIYIAEGQLVSRSTLMRESQELGIRGFGDLG